MKTIWRVILLLVSFFDFQKGEAKLNSFDCDKKLEYISIDSSEKLILNRIKINDSTFFDGPLFCEGDSFECGIKFYVSNSDWFIWTGKGWSQFYSKSMNRVYVDTLFYLDEQIVVDQVYLSNKNEIYALSLNSTIGVMHYDAFRQLLFSPDAGIVIFNFENTFYVRTDFCDSVIVRQLLKEKHY